MFISSQSSSAIKWYTMWTVTQTFTGDLMTCVSPSYVLPGWLNIKYEESVSQWFHCTCSSSVREYNGPVSSRAPNVQIALLWPVGVRWSFSNKTWDGGAAALLWPLHSYMLWREVLIWHGLDCFSIWLSSHRTLFHGNGKVDCQSPM